MMTQKFFICCIFSVLFTGLASAAIDTTQTPANLIKGKIVANEDVAVVMENAAVNAKTIRLNPRAVTFVQDYTNTHTKSLHSIKDWGRSYLKIIDDIFHQYGLPTELKYLAIVESRLKSGAVSHVGAVGPWQFMPATAKNYGLKITKTRDDRKDYIKSTHAAAKYLKYLYGSFGDWLLVVAAYNSGPGYVYNAIKKSKSRNFWDLQHLLPAESRNHVKRFIGTHYILEGQGGICTLTRDEATEQIGALAGYLQNRNLTAAELNNSRTTTVSGKYRASVIAKYVNMDEEEFDKYNPYFDKLVDGSENSYDLKLPEENMEKFEANKYSILNESVQLLQDDQPNTAGELAKKFQTTAIK